MSKHKVYCGGITPSASGQEEILELDVREVSGNINLKIMDIHRSMVVSIPDTLMDLLEVAAYVYCADQRVKRGGDTLSDTGGDWRRDFHYVIPVRNPDLWNSTAVKDALADTLWFLTEDSHAFEFVQGGTPNLNTAQAYLQFDGENEAAFQPDEVALFSGGLDSFAGAVDSLIGQNKKMALVGHHSCSKIFAAQKQIIADLKAKGLARQIFYVPVEVTNRNTEPSEYTQRGRSFLYASLGITIAQLFGKDSIRFFENGVVSLNLPISSDVVGARATRTTHPRVLEGFSNIFTAVLGKPITVENPYAWKTKAEVIRIIAQHDCQHIIPQTRSCTRPRTWTNHITHCGVCSQCIDRRFGVLAAGMGDSDPEDRYKVDLLLGDRSNDREIIMAAHYVRFARNVGQTGLDAFQREFPEIVASIGHFPGLTANQAIEQAHALLLRHAADVNGVIEQGLKDHARKVASHTLAPGSLLSLVANRRDKIEIGQAPDTAAAMKEFVDRLSAPVCDFFVDMENKRIVFAGDFYLENTEYLFIMELLPNFRNWKRSGGDEIKCVGSDTLAKHLYRGDGQSLRTMITRLRNKLQSQLGVDQGITLDTDDFIENKPGHGYRLNKHLRELASPGDLTRSQKMTVTA